jgi:hypothetical protein
MATTKWIQIEGWLLIVLGGILLFFGIWKLDMTYTPGPGPESRYTELWDMLYIQAGIVIFFFGLKLSRGSK